MINNSFILIFTSNSFFLSQPNLVENSYCCAKDKTVQVVFIFKLTCSQESAVTKAEDLCHSFNQMRQNTAYEMGLFPVTLPTLLGWARYDPLASKLGPLRPHYGLVLTRA